MGLKDKEWNALQKQALPPALILTYAIEMVHVSNRDDNRQLRVAYNAIYRKLFGFSYRESVTALQHALDRPMWEEMIEDRKNSIAQRLSRCPSRSLVHAFN